MAIPSDGRMPPAVLSPFMSHIGRWFTTRFTKSEPNTRARNTGSIREMDWGIKPKRFILAAASIFPPSTRRSARCWKYVLENLARISSCIIKSPIGIASVTPNSAPWPLWMAKAVPKSEPVM